MQGAINDLKNDSTVPRSIVEGLSVAKVQNFARTMARHRKGQWALSTNADLLNFGAQYELPRNASSGSALGEDELVVLRNGYKVGVSALAFSSMKMLHNFKLAYEGRDGVYSVMFDGTAKMHYGKWKLITLGFPGLRWDKSTGCYCQQFHPVAYMFADEESEPNFTLFFDALEATLLELYNLPLEPVATQSDRSQAARNAVLKKWPDAKVSVVGA